MCPWPVRLHHWIQQQLPALPTRPVQRDRWWPVHVLCGRAVQHGWCALVHWVPCGRDQRCGRQRVYRLHGMHRERCGRRSVGALALWALLAIVAHSCGQLPVMGPSCCPSWMGPVWIWLYSYLSPRSLPLSPPLPCLPPLYLHSLSHHSPLSFRLCMSECLAPATTVPRSATRSKRTLSTCACCKWHLPAHELSDIDSDLQLQLVPYARVCARVSPVSFPFSTAATTVLGTCAVRRSYSKQFFPTWPTAPVPPSPTCNHILSSTTP